MKKILKSLLAILLVAGVTYAAVNLNLTSGQAITQDVWSEVVTKLNKIDNLETEITALKTKNTELETKVNALELSGGSIVTQIATESVTSNVWKNWEIPVVPNKPVIIGAYNTTTNPAHVYFKVIDGADIGKNGNDGYYYGLIGALEKWPTSPSTVIVPTKSTLTLSIRAYNTTYHTNLIAYQ